MSTVKEIATAIKNLSLRDRAELVACLPALFPELNGDAAWESIIRDPRPRSNLTALLDQVEEENLLNSKVFQETTDSEFDYQS